MERAAGEVAEELRALAIGYAAAVDRRDGPTLRRLFAADAALTVRDVASDREPTQLVGDEIAGIADAISRFPSTFHLLGQSSYDVDGERATGEVYCEAHHHVGALGDESVDRVMYIRYHDGYRREADRWVIAAREVEVLWSTDLPVPASRHRR